MLAATHAELAKILTLRRVRITTSIILGLYLLVLLEQTPLMAHAVARITPNGTIEIFTGEPQSAARGITDSLVASPLQIGIFLPVLGAVIASQEFGGRQLGATMLAVPRRARLFAAKTLAAAGYLLAVAIVMAGMSTAFMYSAIKNWNPGLLLNESAFAGQGKFLAFAVAFALTGFAITTLARSALTGIIVTVALIVVTLTQAAARVAPALDALFPVSAARNLLLDPDQNRLSASPGDGLAVLAGWAAMTTLCAGIALSRRDAG
jgi:ABC-type transport system involved in multi-copper enzyme maturation permease subunit